MRKSGGKRLESRTGLGGIKRLSLLSGEFLQRRLLVWGGRAVED